MGYSGPGYGILSLAVSEKYIWCLDYKGGLFCSALPGAGLRWQKFEDAVQQVAVSPSGSPPRLPASYPSVDVLAHSSPVATPSIQQICLFQQVGEAKNMNYFS